MQGRERGKGRGKEKGRERKREREREKDFVNSKYYIDNGFFFNESHASEIFTAQYTTHSNKCHHSLIAASIHSFIHSIVFPRTFNTAASFLQSIYIGINRGRPTQLILQQIPEITKE